MIKIHPLVTAVALAAVGVAIYERYFAGSGNSNLPMVPVPVESPRNDSSALQVLPPIPIASLPSIPTPPAEVPLVIPVASTPLPVPPAASTSEPSTGGATGTPPEMPVAAAVPLAEAPNPYQVPMPPVVPSVPPLQMPAAQAQPAQSPPAVPAVPLPGGTTLTAPLPPASIEAPLPEAAAEPKVPARAASKGKFIVLKGNKLIEGQAVMGDKKVVLRQGAIDRAFPREEVSFIGESRDDVYHFVLGQVPAADPVKRLAVARWCMLNGLRDQALTEAKEILRIDPDNKVAAEMARSLAESLERFPTGGSPSAPAKPETGSASASDADIDVTPEAATTFSMRVQPLLANQCVECHARPDHAGKFKLMRSGPDAGPQTIRTNLKATASQISRSDPLNSPLLAKTVQAHGGQKLPTFSSRQLTAYRLLEAWVVLAVGVPTGPLVPQAIPPAFQPATPAQPPVAPMVPAATVPSVPPASNAVVLPPVEPIPVPATPVPPVVSVPAAPPATVPAPPPASVPPPVNVPAASVPEIPRVLPTPPSLPSVPAIPALPTTPGVVLPPLPGKGAGEGFGSASPPRPLPRVGTAGKDEFDPSVFNQQNDVGK
jgi:hypothetical protein